MVLRVPYFSLGTALSSFVTTAKGVDEVSKPGPKAALTPREIEISKMAANRVAINQRTFQVSAT